jgi:threonine dehydrogenase-like Zn-dependent dehydrogenase
MLGQVAAVGPAVIGVRPGDYAVVTVRRGCDRCRACALGRPDMCETGGYRERGIWGLDGCQSEYVIDREPFVIPVPRELHGIAVVVEPLSIAEKALDETIRLQTARLPDAPRDGAWLFGRRSLVAGLGPIGLLAAMVLRLRGAEVWGLDIADAGSARPRWFAGLGGHYLDGREVPVTRVRDRVGPMDLVLDASGAPGLAFDLLGVLAPGGICVMTGIPGTDHPLTLSGAALIRQLVLGNQLILGAVNASSEHFAAAVADLTHASRCWGDHLAGLVTHRYSMTEFEAPLRGHPAGEIKAVIEWARLA